MDRHITLLHALAEQIMLHDPGLATFPSELAEFDTVPGGKLIKISSKVEKLEGFSLVLI